MKLFSKIYYHGSGAKFTEFDFDFVGTGEGQQVHGWGIYLCERIDTAKTYVHDGMLATVHVDDDCVFARESMDLSAADDIVKDAFTKAYFNDFNFIPDKDLIYSTLIEFPNIRHAESLLVKFIDSGLSLRSSDHDTQMMYDRCKEIDHNKNLWKHDWQSDIVGYVYDTIAGRMGAAELSMFLLHNGVDGISYSGREDGECVVLFNLNKCKIIKEI